jgi:general secretion pathway protein M
VNAGARRVLSALGVVAVVALALVGAASTALSLRDARAEVAALGEQDAALQSRESRLTPRLGRDAAATPFFEARTVTQAGAALQTHLEAAVAAAHGRLISSKVEVAPRDDERRLDLSAELTIAEPDMQALLFDLETGRPYLFVDSIEARATEPIGDNVGGAMHVALSVSGQWSRNP